MDNHNEEIKNLQRLLGDLHEAIVGNLSGKEGLISSVRQLEAKLVLIEQKLKETDKSAEIKIIKEEMKEAVILTQSLKQEIKIVRDNLQEVRPEIEDTKHKKWLFWGGVIAITSIISCIKFFVSVILPLLKGKP